MGGLLDEVRTQKAAIESLAAQYGIVNIRVFGSTVRGEERPDSDIDFLVDLKPEAGLFDLCGFIADGSDLLGRRVDAVPADSVHWVLKRFIFAEAQPL